MVARILVLASLPFALVACGTVEENAWTVGIARADATEVSRLIHVSYPECKITQFAPYSDSPLTFLVYADCGDKKPPALTLFMATKVQRGWKIDKDVIIVAEDRSPSNQALERTADRREDLFSVTSTDKSEAKLALVSGRSASSR